MREIETHHRCLVRPEAAHHRAGVEMTLQKAARRKPDCDRGKNDADERGQAQKFLRTIESRAYLGTRVAYAFDALSGLELLDRPCAILINRLCRSRDEKSVAYAASRLHEASRFDVGFVDDDARAAGDEADRGIGFMRHDRGRGERELSQL